jgi:hypothetical protein
MVLEKIDVLNGNINQYARYGIYSYFKEGR